MAEITYISVKYVWQTSPYSNREGVEDLTGLKWKAYRLLQSIIPFNCRCTAACKRRGRFRKQEKLPSFAVRIIGARSLPPTSFVNKELGSSKVKSYLPSLLPKSHEIFKILQNVLCVVDYEPYISSEWHFRCPRHFWRALCCFGRRKILWIIPHLGRWSLRLWQATPTDGRTCVVPATLSPTHLYVSSSSLSHRFM